jgi:hypothetical protein
MSQSATTTITRTVTVAAGVFAPGHLGELTRYLPFELVDDVLEQTRTVQRRLRDLPSRVGVYFVLALGLFPRLGYTRVWTKLTTGLAGILVASPSEKALRDLRRRLGPAPMKALFDVVAGPLAQPRTPGVRFAGLRTVAFDGLNSLKVPDTDRNRAFLGLYCATTRRWVGDLPFCPYEGDAMLSDRAVSTDVLDHGAVVRLAGLARSTLRHQGRRDPGVAP